ncbi:hypothetical protein FCM35_KLT11555 [Carex littledalei]|uniref:Uncharacterized protein n=1 Tax=Carex littledalei TaxID=544730 RepID=A0A833VIJ6_9POAL|nr:hypothetical protein FCM35_KLT11555 [Carex littledalei]
MEETGMSVLDLLATTIDIARQDYTSELVTRRDHIMQGLYGGIQCLNCTDMGRDQLASTEAPVSDMETQICTMDQGKSKLPGPPEVVLTGNSNQNLSVEATERPKSNSHVTKATETKNSEMSKLQVQKDFSEKIFENTKRRLRENYEIAMCAKRQRSVKMLSINELPKQGNPMPLHKSARAPSRAASRIGGH